jgi:hypothetical protein
MAKEPLFSNHPATDLVYINTRDVDDSFARYSRKQCERLWEIYEPYSDSEFLTEIRSHFDARYWEMYLTTSLIDQGYKVTCPKPGPDVGIFFNEARIWFEATSPTRGADNSLDQVPESKNDVMQIVPNEKMVLRYLNSISEKYLYQYKSWIRQGIISPTDQFLIAINPRSLGHEHTPGNPPRILQAAFNIGNPYATIDSKTAQLIKTGYQFRDVIEKSSGAPVQTGVFMQDEYSGLSGLLCSRIDVANQPERMGADFELVPNPKAKVPLWSEFRLRGTYYNIDKTEHGYRAVPETP